MAAGSLAPTGPLAGVRIVDFTTMISGPFATVHLGDQGADVIKIEPLKGDEARRLGPPVNDIAACFFTCNRNKRSLSIDLKNEEGKAAVRELIKTADVVIQNFRPGAIDRMGFGEEQVRTYAPDVVYVSISGFGDEGPYANQRVYDPVIQALSSAGEIQANKETGRPQLYPLVIADKVTGLYVCQSLTAALFARERNGVAQHVRISMLDSMLSFLWPQGMVGQTYEAMEFDLSKVKSAGDSVFETLDGFVTLTTVSNVEWAGLARAVGKPEWIEDERFADYNARARNGPARLEAIQGELGSRSTADVIARLTAEDVPCAELLRRTDLMTHPQVQANTSIETHAFDGFGNVRQSRPAGRFESTPSSIRSAAPQLGEHSREVLGEAGLTDSQVDALISAGVVHAGE